MNSLTTSSEGVKRSAMKGSKTLFENLYQNFRNCGAIENVQKYLMLYKKVCNYCQANQQQAKHDAKWPPILSLRAVLA